jgi:hypothetical protein
MFFSIKLRPLSKPFMFFSKVIKLRPLI